MYAWNLADALDLIAELRAEHDAVVQGGRRLAWREVERRAQSLAAWMKARGATHQGKVAVYSYNHPAYMESIFAAMKAGLVPVNVNYRYRAGELRYLLQNADAEIAVVHEDFVPLLEEVRAELASLRGVLVVAERGAAALPAGADDYESVASAGDPAPAVTRSPDDLLLLYTGGTTGLPKGVMWRHEDLFFGVIGGAGVARRGIPRLDDPAAIGPWARKGTGIDRRIPFAPMMHGLAQWTALTALLTGGTLVLDTERSFAADRALALVDEERIELVQLVGDVLALRIADELRRHGDRYDLSALKMISSSGAVLSPSVQADLRELLPNAKVVNRFGASETGPQGRVAHERGDEAPRLIADDTVAVLDEDFRPVAPGETGLLARTGPVPLGYWNDPERTARTFPVVDGVRWSVPGDRARIEPDGSIVVLGRGSVVINSGGEKIFPEEVEAALKAHPAVFDAIVVGIPDERFGQSVAAVVALREGAEDPGIEALTDHARGRIAGYKVPRRITVVDEVQRTAVGKADYAWAKEVFR